MDRTYRSYHSELKLQLAENKLPDNVSKLIPRSTKQRWKNKTIDSFWSPLPIENNGQRSALLLMQLQAENKLLKSQLKILFRLVLLLKTLLKFLPVKSTHVLKIRKENIRLLEECKESNLDKKIWRYLPFTYKQWNSWGNHKQCLKSLQGLCRKQNTQQLSIKEQNSIHSECTDKKYSNWPLCSIYFQLLRDKKIHCNQGTFTSIAGC